MYVDITPGNKTNSCMGMNLNFLKSGSSYAITHIYLLIIFTEIFYKCIIIFFPKNLLKICILDMNKDAGEKAQTELNKAFGDGSIFFYACDVTKNSDLESE